MQFQKGDLVEIIRYPAISHWGVVVDFGKIIHITCDNAECDGPMEIITRCFTKSVVRCEKLSDVAGTSKVIVNNSLDGHLKAKVKEEIVKYGEECLGKEGYSILFGNCETFANMCRYGNPVSFQAVNVLQILVALRAGIEVGKLTKWLLEDKIGVFGATVAGVIAGTATVCLTMTAPLIKEYITSAVIEASKYILLRVGLAATSNVVIGFYLFYLLYKVVTSEAFKTIFGWLRESFTEFFYGLYNLVARGVTRLRLGLQSA